MEAKYLWMNSLVTKTKNEFSQYPELQWLNPHMAKDSEDYRTRLLQTFKNVPLFKDTKPYLNHISKGCQICGSGKWSCLFITNKCNANCFYCPAPQKNDELPSTQGIDFDNPYDYANYINHFGFEGVSFSGGEPLLYFDRTLEYLKVLRQKCNPNLYIWMYTNGLLGDESKLRALAKENLNEIRFDIGATEYNLNKVKIAKGIIPVITIEIPCVPEEKDRIIQMLPKMVEAGVSNLNLHHLRLTHHNVNKLIERNYHILCDERPLVVESELAALEIIYEAQKCGLETGINYCSFHFKNRFQKAGYRRIISRKIFPDAIITENGYIREYSGDAITYKTIRLFRLQPGTTGDITININGANYLCQLLTIFTENKLTAEQQLQINTIMENEPTEPPSDLLLFKIWQLEYIERSLREY